MIIDNFCLLKHKFRNEYMFKLFIIYRILDERPYLKHNFDFGSHNLNFEKYINYRFKIKQYYK